jgi:hypothetical protein
MIAKLDVDVFMAVNAPACQLTCSLGARQGKDKQDPR